VSIASVHTRCGDVDVPRRHRVAVRSRRSPRPLPAPGRMRSPYRVDDGSDDGTTTWRGHASNGGPTR